MRFTFTPQELQQLLVAITCKDPGFLQSTFYHGTHSGHIDEVIQGPQEKVAGPYSFSLAGPGLYITPDRKTAYYYARRAKSIVESGEDISITLLEGKLNSLKELIIGKIKVGNFGTEVSKEEMLKGTFGCTWTSCYPELVEFLQNHFDVMIIEGTDSAFSNHYMLQFPPFPLQAVVYARAKKDVLQWRVWQDEMGITAQKVNQLRIPQFPLDHVMADQTYAAMEADHFQSVQMVHLVVTLLEWTQIYKVLGHKNLLATEIHTFTQMLLNVFGDLATILEAISYPKDLLETQRIRLTQVLYDALKELEKNNTLSYKEKERLIKEKQTAIAQQEKDLTHEIEILAPHIDQQQQALLLEKAPSIFEICIRAELDYPGIIASIDCIGAELAIHLAEAWELVLKTHAANITAQNLRARRTFSVGIAGSEVPPFETLGKSDHDDKKPDTFLVDTDLTEADKSQLALTSNDEIQNISLSDAPVLCPNTVTRCNWTIHAENANAEAVFCSVMSGVEKNRSTSVQSVLSIAKRNHQRGKIQTYVFDRPHVQPDALAVVYHLPDGSHQILLPAQDYQKLYVALVHELTHATLPLASGDEGKRKDWLSQKYAALIRQAVCEDYWDYKRIKSNLVPIQQNTAYDIFYGPHSDYSVSDRLPERLAFALAAMANSEAAVTSVAPRTASIVAAYIEEYLALYIAGNGNVGAMTPLAITYQPQPTAQEFSEVVRTAGSERELELVPARQQAHNPGASRLSITNGNTKALLVSASVASNNPTTSEVHSPLTDGKATLTTSASHSGATSGATGALRPDRWGATPKKSASFGKNHIIGSIYDAYFNGNPGLLTTAGKTTGVAKAALAGLPPPAPQNPNPAGASAIVRREPTSLITSDTTPTMPWRPMFTNGKRIIWYKVLNYSEIAQSGLRILPVIAWGYSVYQNYDVQNKVPIVNAICEATMQFSIYTMESLLLGSGATIGFNIMTDIAALLVAAGPPHEEVLAKAREFERMLGPTSSHIGLGDHIGAELIAADTLIRFFARLQIQRPLKILFDLMETASHPAAAKCLLDTVGSGVPFYPSSGPEKEKPKDTDYVFDVPVWNLLEDFSNSDDPNTFWGPILAAEPFLSPLERYRYQAEILAAMQTDIGSAVQDSRFNLGDPRTAKMLADLAALLNDLEPQDNADFSFLNNAPVPLKNDAPEIIRRSSPDDRPDKPKYDIQWDALSFTLKATADGGVAAGVQVPVVANHYPATVGAHVEIHSKACEDIVNWLSNKTVDGCKETVPTSHGDYIIKSEKLAKTLWRKGCWYSVKIKDPDGHSHTYEIQVKPGHASLDEQINKILNHLIQKKFNAGRDTFTSEYSQKLAAGDFIGCQNLLNDFTSKFSDQLPSSYKNAYQHQINLGLANERVKQLAEGPIAHIVSRIEELLPKNGNFVNQEAMAELLVLKNLFLQRATASHDLTVLVYLEKLQQITLGQTIVLPAIEDKSLPDKKDFKSDKKGHARDEMRNKAQDSFNRIFAAYKKYSDACQSGSAAEMEAARKDYNTVLDHEYEHVLWDIKMINGSNAWYLFENEYADLANGFTQPSISETSKVIDASDFLKASVEVHRNYIQKAFNMLTDPLAPLNEKDEALKQIILSYQAIQKAAEDPNFPDPDLAETLSDFAENNLSVLNQFNSYLEYKQALLKANMSSACLNIKKYQDILDNPAYEEEYKEAAYNGLLLAVEDILKNSEDPDFVPDDQTQEMVDFAKKLKKTFWQKFPTYELLKKHQDFLQHINTLSLFTNPILAMLPSELDRLHPSRFKTCLQIGLKVITLAEIMMPNVVPLSVNGVYAYITGDTDTTKRTLSMMADHREEIFSDFSLNHAMMWIQVALQATQWIPLEDLVPYKAHDWVKTIRHYILSSLHVVSCTMRGWMTVNAIWKGQWKSPTVGLTVFDGCSYLMHSGLASHGQAIETADYFRAEDSVRSVLQMCGAIACVSPGGPISIAAGLFGWYCINRRTESVAAKKDATQKALSNTINNIIYNQNEAEALQRLWQLLKNSEYYVVSGNNSKKLGDENKIYFFYDEIYRVYLPERGVRQIKAPDWLRSLYKSSHAKQGSFCQKIPDEWRAEAINLVRQAYCGTQDIEQYRTSVTKYQHAVEAGYETLGDLLTVFGGLPYNADQPPITFMARKMHLLHLIETCYAAKNFEGMLELTATHLVEMKWVLHPVYQIPPHLAIEVIMYRLVAIMCSDPTHFHSDYEEIFHLRLVSSVINHGTPDSIRRWLVEELPKVEEKLEPVVQHALRQCIMQACDETDPAQKRLLLSQLTQKYSGCKRLDYFFTPLVKFQIAMCWLELQDRKQAQRWFPALAKVNITMYHHDADPVQHNSRGAKKTIPVGRTPQGFKIHPKYVDEIKALYENEVPLDQNEQTADSTTAASATVVDRSAGSATLFLAQDGTQLSTLEEAVRYCC